MYVVPAKHDKITTWRVATELGVGQGGQEKPSPTLKSVYLLLTLYHRRVDWAGFAMNLKSRNGSRLVTDELKRVPEPRGAHGPAAQPAASHVSPKGSS